ncbi:MAG: alpha-N-arabinofuranosidase [Halioglobus sp.]|nr:alpha-N-arabinofuranosidase [Halioglobus sp.]
MRRGRFTRIRKILPITALIGFLLPIDCWAGSGIDASEIKLHIDSQASGPTINSNIFGQFVEHLGANVYGGIWVGPDSPIPNVRGIRSDVVAALKHIKVPNVRWPGGCYAEEYHWRKGIGATDQRPETINIAWGNVVETNAFGTHEFFDFIDQIGSEAFLNINVGSGTVQEATEWLEYITGSGSTTLARERKANGHAEPWKVQFLGIGNESWACGGAMSAETYIALMKRYAMFVRNLHPEQMAPNRFVSSKSPMIRIAVGPGEGFEDYTEEVMKAWKTHDNRWNIEGLSLHRYTMGPRGAMRDPGTDFGEADYAAFIENTYAMEAFIDKHIAIMDKYDPQNEVLLAVDEWGTWLQPMADTNMLFLKQQNSLRDAVVAAIHLNMFVRKANRIRLANIAQLANVLQAMILTEDEKMLLTPTYHIFEMYVPFQNAQALPVTLEQGQYQFENIMLPQVDGIAAKSKDGHLYLALTNIDAHRVAAVSTNIDGFKPSLATGHVLTAPGVDTVNTFENPDAVVPVAVTVPAESGKLILHLPPRSVTVVRMQ